MDLPRLLAQHQAMKQSSFSRFHQHWVLREGDTTRLVFFAEFVDNDTDPDAGVHGTFFFQRKSPKAGWEPVQSVSLNTLKAGEGVKLELKAAEVLQLYRHLHGRLSHDPTPEQLLDMLAKALPNSQPRTLTAEEALALSNLLSWALTFTDGLGAVVDGVTKLSPAALANLSASVQLASLTELQSQLAANRANALEEFWQELLSTRPILLQQLFEFPITIGQSKAYVGGKTISNEGGKVVDFLVKNSITSNASLVEIKTPAARLLQTQPYRVDVYACSSELSGSISQILTYRDSLQKAYCSLGLGFDSFEPRCVVIIGNASAELDSEPKRRSFELLRSQFSSVRIVTFDELEGRLASLISLLKAV